MNRVLHLLTETFSRSSDAQTGYDATRESASHDFDALDGYVKALEEARERRGRLLSRH
jgi:hypothetical protein